MNHVSSTVQLSYPPAFRHRKPTTSPTSPLPPPPPRVVAAPPVIDLENPDMEMLREACREWGVFRVANHGVPTPLTGRLMSRAREFFLQPFESKVAAAAGSKTTSYSWGNPLLNLPGSAVGEKEDNWFEGVNFTGLSRLAGSGCSGSDPTDLGSLKMLIGEHAEHVGRIARKLVEAMGELLGMDHCGAYLSESTGHIRIYRYPQPPAQHQTAAAPLLGMPVHTDSSMVSIVLEDDRVSGIQIIRDGANWLTLKLVPGTLLVNVGDLFQAMSNDEFKSVRHRVKLERGNEDRISICYFVFEVVSEEDKTIEASNYKPFSYREFQQQMEEDILNLGYKIGLERFKRVA